MDRTSPPKDFLPDRVAGGLMLVGDVVLIGFAIWSRQRVWESVKDFHADSPFIQPVSAPVVAAALLTITLQAWVALGVAKSRGWAIGLMTLDSALRLARFSASTDVLRQMAMDPHASSMGMLAFSLWGAGAFAFTTFAYGVLRLFRLLGRRTRPEEELLAFSADRLAGGLMAVGFVALQLWAFGIFSQPDLATATAYHRTGLFLTSASFYASGAFTVAIVVLYAIGISRSQRWALVVSTLAGANGALSLLHHPELPYTLALGAFWLTVFLYCGLRLLASIKPPYDDDFIRAGDLPTAPTR